jgi:hypothetical protein
MKHPLNAWEDERSSLGARSSPPAGTITGSTWSWDPMSPTIPFLPWILNPGRKQREKKHRKNKKMKKVSICVFFWREEHLLVTSVFGTGRPCETFQALQLSAEALDQLSAGKKTICLKNI